jgi:glutathione synthase/RimK-type ligase-like ATP-grasp enzyme
MSRIFIYAYNAFSESARLLSEALDCYRLKHRNSRYIPRVDDIVINWGKAPYRHGVKVLNNPDAVLRAINKHRAFQAFKDAGVSIPRFTTSAAEARGWGADVVCRTIVDGHEGAGILMWNHEDGGDLPPAPLYVEYIKKIVEFRVHVGRLPDHPDGSYYRIIDYARKAKRIGHEGARDTRIRNTANGYVFVRNGVVLHADAINQSIEAVKALGLDFGAVDVIYNQYRNKYYVLEVNTAPGIEGTTVTKYAEYFREFTS